jgi:hypothetical protein
MIKGNYNIHTNICYMQDANHLNRITWKGFIKKNHMERYIFDKLFSQK